MTNTYTSENIETRLANLKTQIENGKVEKTRAETNLEAYTKQRDEIVAQMAALGVTPETVEAEIGKLQEQIKADLASAEGMLAG